MVTTRNVQTLKLCAALKINVTDTENLVKCDDDSHLPSSVQWVGGSAIVSDPNIASIYCPVIPPAVCSMRQKFILQIVY